MQFRQSILMMLGALLWVTFPSTPAHSHAGHNTNPRQCVRNAADRLLINELEFRGYIVSWEEPEEELYTARIATCEVGDDLSYPGDDAGGTVTLWTHIRNNLGTVVVSEESGSYGNSRYLSDNTNRCLEQLRTQPFEVPSTFIVECKCSPRSDYPKMADLKISIRSSDYTTYLFREQVMASFGSSSYLSDNQNYCAKAKASIRICNRANSGNGPL